MTISKNLAGMKIAVLVANGFSEEDLTETQRLLQASGTFGRIISIDQGLVNGWHGRTWGHHFAVDTLLNTALAADYDMLIVPGGQRSLDKLKLTAHTRRFISGFIATAKPVIVFGEALQLLLFAEQVRGRTVTGPEILKDQVEAAGGTWAADSVAVDRALVTGSGTDESRVKVIEALAENFLTVQEKLDRAA